MRPRTRELVERVLGMLHRQRKLLEDSLVELDAGSAESDAELSEEYLERERRRTQQIAQMDDELQILKREWEAAEDVTDADRRRVREQARETRELAEQLQTRIESTGVALSDQMKNLNKSIEELNRGKTMIRGYKIPGKSLGGGLDREA